MINIYKLIHLDTLEVRYVGKTKESLKRRLNKHLYNKKNNAKVNKWVRKLLLEKKLPIIELIERCEFDVWQQREIYWINFYSNYNLMNITPGGESGSLGYKHTEEAKKRISILNSRKKSKEWVEKATTEMIKTVSKNINQYDLKMNFIKKWGSFCFAAKEINFGNYKSSIKNIHACCNYKRKTAYGFIWRYSENTDLQDKELVG